MKKKLFLGLLAAAAVSFTACQKDEVLNEVQQDNAIGFGTYVGRDAQTKATSINNAASLQTASTTNGFGVFAYYTENDTWDPSNEQFDPNFMNNINVYYNSSAWTYYPLRYWPKSQSDKISFLAYYPWKQNTTLNNGEITFTLSNNIPDQIDLMYNTNDNCKNLNTPDAAVSFNFGHALSRIGFQASAPATQATPADANTNITIKQVTLTFVENTIYTTNDFNLVTKQWDPAASKYNSSKSFTWKTETDVNSESPKSSGTLQNNQFKIGATAQGSLNKEDSYLMIPPVENAQYTIKVDYEVETGGVVVQNTYTTPTGTITFAQGKAYSFNLKIGLTAISFDAEVTDWYVVTPLTDVSVQ